MDAEKIVKNYRITLTDQSAGVFVYVLQCRYKIMQKIHKAIDNLIDV